jgi:hypothetical protein
VGLGERVGQGVAAVEYSDSKHFYANGCMSFSFVRIKNNSFSPVNSAYGKYLAPYFKYFMLSFAHVFLPQPTTSGDTP